MKTETFLRTIVLFLLWVLIYHVSERLIQVGVGLTIAFTEMEVTGQIDLIATLARMVSGAVAVAVTYGAYRYMEGERAVVPYE
jgi:ABC-type arginine transport system permease subunit